MRTVPIHTLTSILIISLIVNHCARKTKSEGDISYYLPLSSELNIWRPVDKPQRFEGEDLLLYINGGAEIYHEYGFRQVITQEYKDKNGTSIHLEIFEMEDYASAYGIYTFKTGDEGQRIMVGNEALLEDYYLNFWKGNYLVTVTGFDSRQETVNGLVAIAEATDSKIITQGRKPPLPDVLPQKNLRKNSIKYLKGNLGLFNHYEFDSENIFGLKEGVIGDYGNFEVFVFRYDDEGKSSKWYEKAKNHIENNPRFRDFVNLGGAFSMRDSEETPIRVEMYQNHIFIILGRKHIDADTILIELKERIGKSRSIE